MGEAVPNDLALQTEVQTLRARVAELERERQSLAESSEAERKRRAALSILLGEISSDLGRYSSAGELTGAVGRRIRAHLKISNCLFAGIDETHGTTPIHNAWGAEGMLDAAAVHPLSDFLSEEFRRTLRDGQTVVVPNTQTAARTDAQLYEALRIRSFIAVPSHRNGEWKFLFVAGDCSPREWGPDEIDLVQEVARQVCPRLERIRAEEALRDAGHRLNLHLDHSPLAVVEWGGDFRIVRWTGVAQRTFGWSSEEALGKRIDELPWIYREDLPAFRGFAEDMFSGQCASTTSKSRNIRKDGAVIHCEWYNTAVRDASGRLISVLSLGQDVTERDQLLERLSRHEMLSENARDIVLCIRREDGRILEANAAAVAAYGFTREELKALSIHDLRAPETRAATDSQMALAGSDSLLFETVHVRKDGRLFPVEVSSQGAVIGGVRTLISVIRDITERRKMEAALRENEERLRLFVEHTPAAVAMFDKEMRYLAVSRRWLTDYRLGQQDILGRSHYEVFPEIPERWREIHRRCLAGAAERCEEDPFPRGDGATDWVRWEIYPWRDAQGEVGGIILFTEVITERKLAQEALRESEVRLRTLADSLPEAAIYRYRHDVTGELHVDFITAGIERLTGVPPAEYMRDAASLERTILAGDYDLLRSAIASSRERLTRFEVEVRRRHRVTGEIRWSLLRSTPTRNPDGSTTWDGIELDITARKHAEEALHESEQRYRQLFESLQDAFAVGEIVCDEAGAPVDWRYLDVNPAFEAMFGRRREELVGGRYRELFPDAPWQYWVPALGCVALTGAPARLGKYGAEKGRYYESIAYSPRHGQFAAIFSDVTERVRAEDARRLSEEKFAKAFARNPAGIVLTSLEDGRILDVNETWQTMFGYNRDEVIGRPAYALNAWPTSEAWEQCVGEVLEKGSCQGRELRVSRRSGQPLTTLASAELLVVAGESLILATWLDISACKQAEEALRASEEKLLLTLEATQRSEALYRGIARNLPDAMVCVVDPEMRCIGIEGALAARWQLEREKVEGRPVLDTADPSSRALVDSHFRSALAGETASYETDVRGSVIWSQYAPLREENGKIVAAMMLALDITERKRVEERLRQAQKLESIGLLAGGIAHDFNNLLTGVMGNASLLLADIDPGRADLVQAIMSSTERAAHLTRQLLAYSGKGQFIVRDLDVSDAVNETADLVQFSIPKSVRLKLDLERRLPAVRMDPGQLQQVLMNLVINAGEAIGEGNSGRITVATSMVDFYRPFVDAAGTDIAPGRYVCVSVNDTGSGIGEEQKAKIFDPFFTTKFLGRGLGLAAVAGILRAQKGAITLDSAPGCGSTFRVFLPAAERHPVIIEEQAASAERAVVLVVDDEAAVRNFIGTTLRRLQYRVLLASDGQEALAVCEREKGRIDAAVLDVVMPLMGANELIPLLRSHHPKLGILLTSGYSEAEARRLCVDYPAAAFIQKPYTARQIAEAVDEILGISRA